METDTSAKTNSGNTAMIFTSLVVILGLLCLTTQISLRFFAAGVALSVKLYQAIVYLCVKVCSTQIHTTFSDDDVSDRVLRVRMRMLRIMT